MGAAGGIRVVRAAGRLGQGEDVGNGTEGGRDWGKRAQFETGGKERFVRRGLYARCCDAVLVVCSPLGGSIVKSRLGTVKGN